MLEHPQLGRPYPSPASESADAARSRPRWAVPIQALAAQGVSIWQRLSPSGQVLVVYLGTRLFSLVSLLFIIRYAHTYPPRPGPDSLLAEISYWDGGWYKQVAHHGYPAHLPVDAAGHVRANPWAFYPAFPFLVGGLSRLFGVGFSLVAAVLNLGLSALAAVLFQRLGTGRDGLGLGRRPVLVAVAAWSLAPAAPVLDFLYTEALACVLVLTVLLLLRRGRYLIAAVPVLILGLTRPLAVPMALTVGVHLLLRLRAARQLRADKRSPDAGFAGVALREQDAGSDGVVLRDRLRSVAGPAVLLLACTVAVLAWPTIAGRVTGVPDAYLETMSAWRLSGTMAPFCGWAAVTREYLPLVPAVLVSVALAIAMIAATLTGPARQLPVDVRVWTLAMLGYLAAVVSPSTSVVRYLVPAFGLWLALGLALTRPGRRGVAAGVLLALAAGQVVWLLLVWHHASHHAFMP